MTAISTAVGSERLSRTTGYKIGKLFPSNETENLPQKIVIIGQPNTANEALISLDAQEIISAEEAGKIFGYGSPIHSVMRILRPTTSEGVGGIPTIVIPQKVAEGATASTKTFIVTGTALQNITQVVKVAGRESLDFQSYSFSISKGETANKIATKIANSVNKVLGSPLTADAMIDMVVFTSKFKGEVSKDIEIEFLSDAIETGITYTQTEKTDGSGLADFSNLKDYFGQEWHTIVLNTYAQNAMSLLQEINGINYLNNPTGLYNPLVFKPFLAFLGSKKEDRADLLELATLNNGEGNLTNVICVAPKTPAMEYEIAANVVTLFARVAQDTPELDVNAMSYPDLPVPSNGVIGEMKDYNTRDLLVKGGVSTVTLDKGVYKIQDLVTTYHTEGENPFQFSYPRNINIDWNVKFGYSKLEDKHLRDRVIVRDNSFTDSRNAIKPKQWKAIVMGYFDTLNSRALINDPDFSKSSLQVEIDSVNPNRFNTFFRYRRTGIARITSTDVEAGF